MFRDGFTRLVDLGLRGGGPFLKLLAICGFVFRGAGCLSEDQVVQSF